MNCPKCGSWLPQNSVFCQKCGSSTDSVSPGMSPPLIVTNPAVTRRQQILQGSDYAREVDVDGNFHPKEFLRKLSREFTILRYSVTREDGRMMKNPVGNQTGEFSGNIEAGAYSVVVGGTCTYADESQLIVMLVLLAILGVIIGVFTHGIGFIAILLLCALLYIQLRDRFKKSFDFGEY